MKDMERWAKIQNQKKEIVRAASPGLRGGTDDDKKQSKSADAGFAVFERKVSQPISKKINMATTIIDFFCCCFGKINSVLLSASLDLGHRRSF